MDENETLHHLKSIDLLKLSLRIFKTKPIRTVLTILGMSVGIGTVLFLISLGYGLQYILIGKLVTSEDSLRTLEAFYPPESSLTINYSKVDEISKLPNVAEVSPVAEFSDGEIKADSSVGLAMVRVIRPGSYFRLSGLKADIGDTFREGENAVIMTNQAARLLNFKPDVSILNKAIDVKINYQADSNSNVISQITATKPLLIKGIIADDLQPPVVYVPEQFLSSQASFFRSVLVKADNLDMVEAIKNNLINRGFLISARLDLINQAKQIMNIFTIVLGVFGIASLVVSAIGMFNTMIVGFLERIYEVGIMKSLGATDRDIKNLFLMESLLMGFLGGAGGVILGIGGGQIANLGLNILARHLGGKPFTLFVVPTWFVILTLGLSSIIGVISGFWPARRAAYLSPREAFVKK